SIAAIITAQPTLPVPEPQQAGPSTSGLIRGTVVRSGSSEPIPGAQVSLVGGFISPQALQTLLTFFANRGVVVSPPTGPPDEKFIQTLIDAAAARGVSTGNPQVQAAMAAFQAANESVFTATTDSTGNFTIKDVPSGQYSVKVRSEGHYG